MRRKCGNSLLRRSLLILNCIISLRTVVLFGFHSTRRMRRCNYMDVGNGQRKTPVEIFSGGFFSSIFFGSLLAPVRILPCSFFSGWPRCDANRQTDNNPEAKPPTLQWVHPHYKWWIINQPIQNYKWEYTKYFINILKT